MRTIRTILYCFHHTFHEGSYEVWLLTVCVLLRHHINGCGINAAYRGNRVGIPIRDPMVATRLEHILVFANMNNTCGSPQNVEAAGAFLRSSYPPALNERIPALRSTSLYLNIDDFIT